MILPPWMALSIVYKSRRHYSWDIKNTQALPPRQGGNPWKGIFILCSPNMFRNDWRDFNLTLLNFRMLQYSTIVDKIIGTISSFSLSKMSKSSVLRVLQKGLYKNPGKNKERKRCKRGRPELFTGRDKRNMRRAIMKLRESGDPNFTIMKMVERSGVSVSRAHYRSFVRHLHKMSFAFRQTRKKGLLNTKDYFLQLKYAKTMLKSRTIFG